ncbi:MAG: hypothetical protein WBJ54_09000 [Syntrophorhabdus sp.]|nr:hypothetical protein [Syntrophorhabdus sp.]MDI9559443.1 hypothetical protein [Pseudomonadota bacterium]OPX96045.1 MAG: hypothetical protein A4E59_01389 [Syntrophorhabdus sp. PtaB.Bin027]OQB76777.1 MAG: hypothetical protein BWX92_01521 [Deltaproteobacteria bacterium ADurb.Bin135]MBP8744653.1 hypothetical protein [Syntrophorhabdus sp.]
MRLTTLPWIVKLHRLAPHLIQKITMPVKMTSRKASLLVTWAMCWYVLATVILIVLHACS